VDVRWQDMAAAVKLAAKHMQESTPGPLYLLGYSNGGALAVDYLLASLDDASLPKPAGVILLSPEIRVSDSAAFAVWQGRLGRLLGMDKLAWVSVTPEFDPYKYGSFAVNAGDLAHRITVHIQAQLDSLEGTGKLKNMAPILAFQSSVDATVSAAALARNLFARLPPAGHELVLFDINRRVESTILVKQDPRSEFAPLLEDSDRGYDLTMVTNENSRSSRVRAFTAPHNVSASKSSAYIGDWPNGVYSLSHVALPFAPNDPIYGGPEAGDAAGIQLGNLALRGERGVLQLSANDAMRLRWNPFFDYIEQRILRFTDLEGQP
jgi:alpha-beta hydrolase superfamily lysophospholipase